MFKYVWLYLLCLVLFEGVLGQGGGADLRFLAYWFFSSVWCFVFLLTRFLVLLGRQVPCPLDASPWGSLVVLEENWGSVVG